MTDMSLNSTWVISTSPATAQAWQTLQDGAPKPQSRYTTASPHTVYRNDLAWSNGSRNAIVFEFSWTIGWFGWWFGDVETRTDGSWTAAEFRVLDASYNTLWQSLIPTSTTDQSLCGDPVNSTYKWCGNQTSRWIAFNNPTNLAIKYALLIIWDDDSDIGDNDGNTEHISFMWWLVAWCSPSAEICDMIDNDCDGETDEGLDQIVSCSQWTGSCTLTGIITIACVAWSFTTGSCSATPWSPNAEICDMIDNDCDGETDEGLDQIYSCSMWMGMCYSAWTYTVSCDTWFFNTWSCSATIISPNSEICDKQDNNCNGLIDDGLVCGWWTAFNPQPLPTLPPQQPQIQIQEIAISTSYNPIKRVLQIINNLTPQVEEQIEEQVHAVAPAILPETWAQ